MNGLAGLETLTRNLHVRGWSYPFTENVCYHPREPSSRRTDYPGYYMPDEHSAEERSSDEKIRCSATDKHNGRNEEKQQENREAPTGD
jgi:hypothetical protein